jgi:hypothetical protein
MWLNVLSLSRKGTPLPWTVNQQFVDHIVNNLDRRLKLVCWQCWTVDRTYRRILKRLMNAVFAKGVSFFFFIKIIEWVSVYYAKKGSIHLVALLKKVTRNWKQWGLWRAFDIYNTQGYRWYGQHNEAFLNQPPPFSILYSKNIEKIRKSEAELNSCFDWRN